MYDHVFAHPEGEVGGVLVGRVVRAGRLEIIGAIPALRAVGHRASVTFTHDAWAEIHTTMERKFSPDQRIVGWYHSHPGFGIFLSEHDLFIHRNFFYDTSQIAYVVDPYAATEGIFGWRDGQVEKLLERRTPRDPIGPPIPKSSDVTPHRPGQLRANATLGVIGALLGAVLWFGALRPDTSTPQTHTTTARVQTVPGKPPGSRLRAHPQPVAPVPGQGSTR
jgi:proteasome lid subunit RPN8/RPN11